MRLQLKYILLFLLLYAGLSLPVFGAGKLREDKLRYNTMYVDANNVLWLGSESGLFKWKNTESVRVPLPVSLNITAILASHELVLLGTAEGKLFIYNTNLKTLKLVGDMKAEISDICVRSNLLSISSKGNGYAVISPYSIMHYTTNNGLTDNFVYKTFIDSNNTIWSSTDLGVNMQISLDSINACYMNRRIPDRLVTCFALADSFLYCGTQGGDVCKINLSDSTVTLFDHDIWNSSQINDLRILDHMIIVATENGAYFLDMKGNLVETTVNNEPVKKIEVDKEATVWLCGNRLLVSSVGEQITAIRTLSGFPLANVHSIFVDSGHTIYLTPDQGLIKFNYSTKRIQKTNLTSPADLIDITSIFIDVHGRIWAGTSGKGLYQVDTTNLSFRKIQIDSSVETSDILTITGDQNNIWVSSLNGVWYSENTSGNYKFRSLEDEYHRKKYYVYDVKKDSKGTLWLATDGQGILRISDGKVADIVLDQKRRPNLFYSIDEDYDGRMWFNAYSDGLYCYGSDSVVHLTKNNGLSSNEILCLRSYQKKYLIAVSSVGIDLIDIEHFTVSSLNFESLHMADIPETNSISADQYANIYIGTNLGILKLYFPSYKTHFIPQAQIDEILVMGKYIVKDKNTFNYEENYFKFLISSNYNTEQMTYYQYKLKGLNEQWNTTVDKEVVFPRLNPGRYEFILQSANNPRFLNATEERYSFFIRNPFWKQNWFVFFSFSVITVIIYYYIRFRESRVSKVQQLEKEKAIAEFETLKHQVNPHFLFNSFNTLIQVIDEDQEKAIEYAQMLSDYYRSLLSYTKLNLVTLEEEFVLLDKYVYLQKMRFGDSLHLHNECSASQITDLMIPPLTLQLLAENAIKHNVISTVKPLMISISIKMNRLVILNNLNEKNHKEEGENIGLQNIRNRFKLFSRQDVEIYKTDQFFEVRLPILNS